MSAALDQERVKEKFYLYSGEDPEETGARQSLCGQLCVECASRAETLLAKSGASAQIGDLAALESWAAAEAFYQLALADEASGPESVSADGVKITAGERSRKAGALAAEKRRAAAGLLGEEGFYFGGI